MASFKDATGKDWPVVITFRTAEELKEQVGVDLLSDTELQRLFDNPVLLCNSLYVACQHHCEVAGIDDRQFGELLVGETIDRAFDAFCEALVDFFPNAARRETLRRMIQKMKDVEAKAMQQATEFLGSKQMADHIEQGLQTLGESFTSSLASSASTPDP